MTDAAREKWSIAGMWLGFALGAVPCWYLLAMERPWSEPFFMPILALCLAWLALTPLLLLAYRRHSLRFLAGTLPDDAVARLRRRRQHELYWWVGESPVAGSAVLVVFTTACLVASAVAGISDGMPLTIAALPLGAWSVAMAILACVAALRVRRLRTQLGEADAAAGGSPHAV
jgi:hypothetical protein